jgi:hypothetical protein
MNVVGAARAAALAARVQPRLRIAVRIEFIRGAPVRGKADLMPRSGAVQMLWHPPYRGSRA